MPVISVLLSGGDLFLTPKGQFYYGRPNVVFLDAVVCSPRIQGLSMDIDHSYRVLDLDAGAAPLEVKKAYKTLAIVWHPDRFRGDSDLHSIAETKLAEINVAYDTIRRHQNEQSQTTPRKTSRPPQNKTTPRKPQTSKPRPPKPQWDPIEIETMTLGRTTFRVGTTQYKYTDITGVHFKSVIKTVDHGLFSTNGGKYIDLSIRTNDSKTHEFTTRWKIKWRWKPIHDRFHAAYEHVRAESATSRLEHYSRMLSEKGYICCSRWANIRIHHDGTVQNGNTRLCLRKARENGTLHIGTHRRTLKTDSVKPTEIAISETGFGWFRKKIIFEVHWDFDVVAAVLDALANGTISDKRAA